VLWQGYTFRAIIACVPVLPGFHLAAAGCSANAHETHRPGSRLRPRGEDPHLDPVPSRNVSRPSSPPRAWRQQATRLRRIRNPVPVRDFPMCQGKGRPLPDSTPRPNRVPKNHHLRVWNLHAKRSRFRRHHGSDPSRKVSRQKILQCFHVSGHSGPVIFFIRFPSSAAFLCYPYGARFLNYNRFGWPDSLHVKPKCADLVVLADLNGQRGGFSTARWWRRRFHGIQNHLSGLFHVWRAWGFTMSSKIALARHIRRLVMGRSQCSMPVGHPLSQGQLQKAWSSVSQNVCSRIAQTPPQLLWPRSSRTGPLS